MLECGTGICDHEMIDSSGEELGGSRWLYLCAPQLASLYVNFEP
jgi:hypothetical protein